MSHHTGLLWLGLLLTGPWCESAAAARYALLVGCTRYPDLSMAEQLEGPGNDVVLFRDLLISRYGFAADSVVLLAEEAGKAQPTRANIAAEFARLAGIARQGDQIVILLSGHGSQQPAAAERHPAKSFGDLDQVFCPRDVKGLEANQSGRIGNAIADYEIHQWLDAILKQGASVWIIIDACHSGTMVRGSGDEVIRRIPAARLVPKRLLDEAAARAARSRGATRGVGSQLPGSEGPAAHKSRLVAFYACQPSELTVERLLPDESPDAKRRGLFSFALAEALTKCARPITYRELLQRIHGLYVKWGRTFPTPGVEGGDQDRFVLDAAEGSRRSLLRLEAAPAGGFRIAAGALHGLTVGSVLAVYPPAGETNADQLLGHVRVTGSRTLDSLVAPCSFERTPERQDLPLGSRCEVVYLDCGLQRLRVAIDERSKMGTPLEPAVAAQWRKELGRLDTGPKSLLRIADKPREADWLVRIDAGRAVLVPAAGWPREDAALGSPEFGPVPKNEAASWLQKRLSAIARATNLLRLAAAPADEHFRASSPQIDVDMEPRRVSGRKDLKGQAVPRPNNGFSFREGDLVAFRIFNRSRNSVYVTLLFVDSGYGITPVFPPPDTIWDNRIPPGEDLLVGHAEISSSTLGREHMVLIAVREPVDFSFLGQPTLENAKAMRGGIPDSPLAQLLKTAMYHQGQTRGIPIRGTSDHAFRVISWRVRAK